MPGAPPPILPGISRINSFHRLSRPQEPPPGHETSEIVSSQREINMFLRKQGIPGVMFCQLGNFLAFKESFSCGSEILRAPQVKYSEASRTRRITSQLRPLALQLPGFSHSIPFHWGGELLGNFLVFGTEFTRGFKQAKARKAG